MKKYVTLATRIALVSGAMGLTASCQSAKVSSAASEMKPAAQQTATLTKIQNVDATSTAVVENVPVNFTPVDLATDRSVEMAYAIPTAKPINGGADAIQAMEVASADTTMTALDPQTSVPTPQTRASAVMLDTFGQPDISAVTSTRVATVVASADPSAATALASTQGLDDDQQQQFAPFASSSQSTNVNQLISKYAALYEVPESMVHHVVRRESNYNPGAVHRGNWGLMQIRYKTARGLGYDGTPSGLLDAETNLKYAVKYLRGAWLVADKNPQKADMLYRTGYYYQAKKKQLLDALGD